MNLFEKCIDNRHSSKNDLTDRQTDRQDKLRSLLV